MSRNKKIGLCFTAALCSVFLLCSRSDVITGAGDGVVSDADPALSGDGGFTLMKLEADSAFSLPAAPNPAFSTHFNAGYIYVGVIGSGKDTLAARMQYAVSAFTGKPPYAPSDSLEGAYLYFSAIDAVKSPDSVNVFPSGPLAGPDPVSRSDKSESPTGGKGDACAGSEGDEEECDEVEDDVPADNRIGSFVLNGEKDSIPIPVDIASKIFDTRTGPAGVVYNFAFSIVDYTGEPRKIRNPHVIVRVVKKAVSEGASDTTVRDSIAADSTRFTVFENAEIANKRAGASYSSQLTLRTAVFKVNIDTIRNGLELMNAAITIGADRAGEGGLVTGPNARSYKIFISDNLLTNLLPADASLAAHRSSLRGLFDVLAPYELIEPYDAFSIKPFLKSAVDKRLQYMYVYLRPVSEHSDILWNKPSMEMIFTPSRSR